MTALRGKVEIGQGIITALAQLASEELDLDISQITMVPANTTDGADEHCMSIFHVLTVLIAVPLAQLP